MNNEATIKIICESIDYEGDEIYACVKIKGTEINNAKDCDEIKGIILGAYQRLTLRLEALEQGIDRNITGVEEWK